MPLYEFVCENCRKPFEELVRSETGSVRYPSVRCPVCGTEKVSRKMSVFAAGRSEPTVSVPIGGGCGRCGDPNGPCAM